jgi:hypothetical protein
VDERTLIRGERSEADTRVDRTRSRVVVEGGEDSEGWKMKGEGEGEMERSR